MDQLEPWDRRLPMVELINHRYLDKFRAHRMQFRLNMNRTVKYLDADFAESMRIMEIIIGEALEECLKLCPMTCKVHIFLMCAGTSTNFNYNPCGRDLKSLEELLQNDAMITNIVEQFACKIQSSDKALINGNTIMQIYNYDV